MPLTMPGGVIALLFVVAVLYLAYRRMNLLSFTLTFTVLLAAYTFVGAPAGVWKGFLWVLLGTLWALNFRPLRKALISRPFLRTYRRLLPSMSSTEKEALEAGTVWWDGELFTGNPAWDKLMSAAPARLSAEEQAFLDGPCEELCRLIDDWDITHQRGDLSPEVWQFLKAKGFFAMIIPKRYGGLEFSAYAHSCVLIKISSRSGTVGSTVAVPNSLGPAELLLHYGTEEQKTFYLPRLARGEEVPCFALTGPRAGSDAAAIPDTGVVCRGLYEGREVIGLKLNFSKRYITLAPVATVVGLAFRLFDPDKLLGGETTDYGITCALIPRNTAGVTIGRRHFPLNNPFQNGPIQGKDVFVPLDFIIGGPKMAGQGWRMLVEQLSVGRCISLPSNTPAAPRRPCSRPAPTRGCGASSTRPSATSKACRSARAHGRQCLPIMDAARSVTIAAIDGGEKPAVPAAMLKYHVTETGPQSWRTTLWTCTAARASASGRATTSAAATRSCPSRSRSKARTSSRAASSSSARVRSAVIRSC
jgi:acyl-CoA dehydrogenase